MRGKRRVKKGSRKIQSFSDSFLSPSPKRSKKKWVGEFELWNFSGWTGKIPDSKKRALAEAGWMKIHARTGGKMFRFGKGRMTGDFPGR